MAAFWISLHGLIPWLILLATGVAAAAGIVWLARNRAFASVRTFFDILLGRTPDGTPPAAAPLAARVFRYTIAVIAGLGALQALFGVLLLLVFHCQPREQLHYVYGLIVLLAIPVAYAYSDKRQVRRDIMILTIAVVVILGAAFRAWSTGPGGICK